MNPIPELDDPTRESCIQQLSELLELEHIDSATWGSLWLADLEKLQELVEQAKKSRAIVYFGIGGEHNVKMAKTCTSRTN